MILYVSNQLYGTIKNVSNVKNKRIINKFCEQAGISK